MGEDHKVLNMFLDIGKLVAKKKVINITNVLNAFYHSEKLANNVGFWNWLGKNYPNTLGNAELIRSAAVSKADWLNKVLQGKGYEWDFMTNQRMNPLNIFGQYDAGESPVQAGIDITRRSFFDGTTKTFQNKAYLSSNALDLHNTPVDSIVVTNAEKVANATKQGYVAQSFMDKNGIEAIRDERFAQALTGSATGSYNFSEAANAIGTASLFGAVISIGGEAIEKYDSWKRGELSDKEFLIELGKAGGDGGVTTGATSALMIPVQSKLTVMGCSSVIGIPIAFVIGKAVNEIVAPCFARGRYREILNEAKYYVSAENIYEDFIGVLRDSMNDTEEFLVAMKEQNNSYNKLRECSNKMDRSLKKLLNSI